METVDAGLLDRAVEWTRAAGELTLGWFNHTELSIDAKGDGSPVTQADRAAERLLRELIEAEFPDDSIHGEEEDDKVGTSGRRWVIDPIDGTKAFTHGVATYSNLLYMEDEHGGAVGVVNLPALNETVAAGRDLGCFFDGAPCRVSTHDTMKGAYLSSTAFELWTPELFGRVTDAGMEVRTWGDAYGYALVASGRVEAMTDPILAWWDLAAMTVIIPEAGGVLTTWDGSDEHVPNERGHYSAVASNGRFHDELIATLQG
jgi:histidinol phosphatase-like enzyme (inositol monophosphatase family)